MELVQISDQIQRNAPWIVFVNVLMQQLGLPVPAVPTLLVAGSLAMGAGQGGQLLAIAVVATLIADLVWYGLGRTMGYRVLSGLCRLSINPASCVSEAEGYFMRWGARALVVAKFVPGFSTVAPPIAGSLRMPLHAFAAASALGALLWAGAALLAGWLFRDELQAVLAIAARHGWILVTLLAALLVLWLAWKFWQRNRFNRMASQPHVLPAELLRDLASDEPPLFLDLRRAGMIAQAGTVPGATVVHPRSLEDVVKGWPRDRAIVTMCACPGDASAVKAAHDLAAMGYVSVRHLKGGHDALAAALPDRVARAA